ncbi:citrate/2-methylcitrate synthase [Ornithinimicrobium panacihumi]|uniref:citrate/2-methylcitrate synthase n=1 Tax=Ornithinimicrobium panacihumi TaxID=2008449 RepID=UPI003F88B3C2
MRTGELTTAQVAEYLGVKVQTVYAYVSRGVLAPVRKEPGTGSLFAVDEVRALLGGGRSGRRTRRPAASDDVRTSITAVNAGGLAYRGHDIAELAGHWSFEQVRALLVTGDGVASPAASLADEAWPDSGARDALGRVMAALPVRTTALDRFKHAVLVAGATDPGRHDRSPAAVTRAGKRALAHMVLAVAGGRGVEQGAPAGGISVDRADHGVAATLTAYLPGCPVELIDAALVLLADHDLAVSTTAVRVAVSSGADTYSALLAGLAAADSPLHVAASLRVVDWLAGAVHDPQSALDEALASGPLPGFGHVMYTEQDPRAQLLLELLAPYARDGALSALRLIERELLQRRGWVLNIDAALALMVHCFDLPRDAGTVVFACARTAGWTAHALEELAEPGMRFRLRGVYEGPRRS